VSQVTAGASFADDVLFIAAELPA